MSAPNANANATTPTTSGTSGFKMSASIVPLVTPPELVFGDLSVVKTHVKPHTTGGAAAPAPESVNLVSACTGAKVAVNCVTCGKSTRVPDYLAKGGNAKCWQCHSKTQSAVSGGSAAPLDKICGDCKKPSAKSYCFECLSERKAQKEERLALMENADIRTAVSKMPHLLDTRQIEQQDFFASMCAIVQAAHASMGALIALLKACVKPANELDWRKSGQLIICFRNDLVAKP
jgi:hypothetical protein